MKLRPAGVARGLALLVVQQVSNQLIEPVCFFQMRSMTGILEFAESEPRHIFKMPPVDTRSVKLALEPGDQVQRQRKFPQEPPEILGRE